MLSVQARREWSTLLAAGSMLTLAAILMAWWITALLMCLATLALLLFFRDPPRMIPPRRHVAVSPADGKISSIHGVDHFEPFEGPAVCVRIFLSVFDVHVNRAPLHSRVRQVTRTPGLHRNVLNPASAEDNEHVLIELVHPVSEEPIAAVRQVAGMIARTICCAVKPDQILQRGQRIGIIKLGSTTELYLPASHHPQLEVRAGDRVRGGETILALVDPPQAAADPEKAHALVMATPAAAASHEESGSG